MGSPFQTGGTFFILKQCYNINYINKMERKTLIWIGVFVGSIVGGSLPMIWGDGMFSFSSNIFSILGGLVGIYLGFKFGE